MLMQGRSLVHWAQRFGVNFDLSKRVRRAAPQRIAPQPMSAKGSSQLRIATDNLRCRAKVLGLERPQGSGPSQKLAPPKDA